MTEDQNVQQEPKLSHSLTLPLFSLGAGLFIVLIVFALFEWMYWSPVQEPPRFTYSPEQTPYKTLVTINRAFAEAEALYQAKQYTFALEKYREALSSAGDPIQTAQIKYKIALSLEKSGRYQEALERYKELAFDETVYKYARAYAVQNMALMYLTYNDARDLIYTETFKDEPFRSFLSDNPDSSLAYRRIFEYGSAIYPLGMLEGRVGTWYASAALELFREQSSPELMAEYVERAKKHLLNMEADIERIKNEPNERVSIPGILIRRGEILLNLAQMNEASPEEAEEAYRQAMEFTDLAGGTRTGTAFDRFFYASFLERYYGDARGEDIRTILAPLYEIPGNTPLTIFFRSQKDADTWMHTSLARMAEIDPKFKEFLLSLDWKEEHFEK